RGAPLPIRPTRFLRLRRPRGARSRFFSGYVARAFDSLVRNRLLDLVCSRPFAEAFIGETPTGVFFVPSLPTNPSLMQSRAAVALCRLSPVHCKSSARSFFPPRTDCSAKDSTFRDVGANRPVMFDSFCQAGAVFEAVAGFTAPGMNSFLSFSPTHRAQTPPLKILVLTRSQREPRAMISGSSQS